MTTTTPEPSGAERFGGHTMTAQLRTALMWSPPEPDPADPDAWRRFGYPRPMDHGRATEEHAALRELLEGQGVRVIQPGTPTPNQHDVIFPYDPSIITDAGAVVLRMGKHARREEPALAEATYRSLSIPVIGRIEEPGTVEGGDTMWLDDRTLAVGVGYRTNMEGIRQLRAIFVAAGLDIEVMPVHLPHWHGPDECLHLLSLISPVAGDLAIAYPPLLAVPFVQELADRGWRLVPIPADELDTQGCNVLTIRPGLVVMLRPNDASRRALEADGIEVLTYAGDEVSHNRAGGPTCLTRPIWRADTVV
jgi:dimethylargininase